MDSIIANLFVIILQKIKMKLETIKITLLAFVNSSLTLIKE